MKRVGVLLQRLDQRMAGFVIGGDLAIALVDHGALFGPPPANLVARFLEILLFDEFLVFQRCDEGSLVHDGGQFRAGGGFVCS